MALQCDDRGAIVGFAARGHAGAGPRGRDVVCAGVSALVQTAALGLERRLGASVRVEAADGVFLCRLAPGQASDVSGRAQDILETMVLGLTEIARGAPGRLVVRRDGPVASAGAVPPA